jgi:hypothetical protein
VVILVSKEGYIAKEADVATSGKALTAKIHTPNFFEINLYKISVKTASLTNNDVLKLHAAGFSDELIIDKITTTPSGFNLELDDLVTLRKAGLSDIVIQAMMHAK